MRQFRTLPFDGTHQGARMCVRKSFPRCQKRRFENAKKPNVDGTVQRTGWFRQVSPVVSKLQTRGTAMSDGKGLLQNVAAGGPGRAPLESSDAEHHNTFVATNKKVAAGGELRCDESSN